MFEVEEKSILENPTELENIEKEKKRFYSNNFHLLNYLSSAYCKCERNHCQLSRITPVSSQVLTVFYNSMPINITLDSGATTSFITEKLCHKLKVPILPNQQLARLGDGCTVIASVGEIDILLTRSTWSVRFRAIVVKTLNTDIYGGMTFLTDNDISMRPKTGEIKINNKHVIFQTNMIMPAPTLKATDTPSSTTVLLNAKKVIFPTQKQIWNETNDYGDPYPTSTFASEENHDEAASLMVVLPIEFNQDDFVVVGSREENANKDWPPPQICQVKKGRISISNCSRKPIRIPKDVHLLDIQHSGTSTVKDIILNSQSLQSESESFISRKDAFK